MQQAIAKLFSINERRPAEWGEFMRLRERLGLTPSDFHPHTGA